MEGKLQEARRMSVTDVRSVVGLLKNLEVSPAALLLVINFI